MNGQNLRQLYESLGPQETVSRITRLLDRGELRPEHFSLRELAESFCGHDWVRRLDNRNTSRNAASLLEAGDAVDVTAFGNITGQIIYSKIHQGWEQVGFIGDELFQTVPTKFDGEKIPGIGRITAEGTRVKEGMPYDELGFGEQYWETPSTTKSGMIVSVTKEAIFFDRTGLVLQRASEVGKRLRTDKEVRQLACYAGVTTTLTDGKTFDGNNHRWNGTAYQNYSTTNQALAGGTIQINSLASTELVDWTSVEKLLLLFPDMLDPDTGRPIVIVPNTLVVMPFKLMTAKRIVSATEVRHGDHDASNAVVTLSANPLGNFKVLSSPLLYQVVAQAIGSATNAKNWWFLGDPKQGFWYMENWPMTVVQAPPNSESEFTRDIVLRWKASERGVPYCADPRYNTKAYVA